MIATMNVENIALIDRLAIDFSEGLNVLSGETGAGKSVLLDAMNLILGERAERTLIRHGENRAHVEAIVYPDDKTIAKLEELGIPCEDGEMIVTRDLNAAGKSVSRINGRAVTLASLRSVMGHLVDLHGQHEHQSLLDSSRHLELLDALEQGAASEKKQQIASRYKAMRGFEKEQASLGGDPKEREDAVELLRFQIKEVRGAQVREGELDALEKEQKRLENAEKMKRTLYGSMCALTGEDGRPESVLSELRSASDALGDFQDLDERLPEAIEACETAYYSLQDVSYTLSTVMDSLEIDDQRVREVEERIDEIRSLLRKYSVLDEESLNARADIWETQLHDLENAESRSAELEGKIEEKKKDLRRLYRELSEVRKKAASRLEKELLKQLSALGMTDAKFEVRFSGLEPKKPVHYGAQSPESAEFYLSVNRGEPLKPLSKTASGGEISRIMLAFKVISAEHDEIGTLIFDEIDTGISGRTAQVVGEKMAQIGLSRQVIAVTHLPQIAAMADRNFYIHKENTKDRTVTYIDELDSAGVRAEMVRLTGGLESQNAEAHADEMMAQAKRTKQQLRTSVGSHGA